MKIHLNFTIKLALLYVMCLILTITGILGTISNSEGKNITYQELVLLNPSNANHVNTITIQCDNPLETLIITLYSGGAIGNYNGIFFPVNTAKALELIHISSTVVNAEYVTSNVKELVLYDVLDNSSNMKKITFSKIEANSETVLSQVFFGNTDYTGTKRYVRSSANSNIYAIVDEYYTFLQVNPSAWVDPKFYPDFLIAHNVPENIASISLNTKNHTTTLYSGDKNFEQSATTLLQSQSSNVVDVKNILTTTFDYEITIIYFNNYSISCAIYVLDTSYIVVPESSQLLYGLDISKWSFDRMLEPFID